MPRIRTIKPEFFSHEDLASKSAHARLLAIGLLTLADCEGRMRWVPMQIHSQVFPWEAEVKIQVLLGELIDCGYVVHYESDGKRYVEICNFKKHQRLSGKESSYASRLPSPPRKPTISLAEHGEIQVKQSGASQGSDGNPLGTGEHRNIGTEDIEREGANEIPFLETRSVAFLEAWQRWKLHSMDKGKTVRSTSEEAQLQMLTGAYPDEADFIAAINHAIVNNWANVNKTSDHKANPPPERNNKPKNKTDEVNDIIKRTFANGK